MPSSKEPHFQPLFVESSFHRRLCIGRHTHGASSRNAISSIRCHGAFSRNAISSMRCHGASSRNAILLVMCPQLVLGIVVLNGQRVANNVLEPGIITSRALHKIIHFHLFCSRERRTKFVLLCHIHSTCARQRVA